MSECRRRVVCQEFIDFFRSRRQAGEIKCRAPDQRPFVGCWGWREPLLFQLGEDEAVEWRLGPGISFCFGRRRILNGLESPERPLGFSKDRVGRWRTPHVGAVDPVSQDLEICRR